MSECFYFGCHREAGHYLFDEQGRHASRRGELSLPFRYSILDSGLLPQGDAQEQGAATIVLFPAWTVISFWDRSVDKRGGCNSAFVLPGQMTFDEAIAVSKEKFPWVWSRLTFEVRRVY